MDIIPLIEKVGRFLFEPMTYKYLLIAFSISFLLYLLVIFLKETFRRKKKLELLFELEELQRDDIYNPLLHLVKESFLPITEDYNDYVFFIHKRGDQEIDEIWPITEDIAYIVFVNKKTNRMIARLINLKGHIDDEFFEGYIYERSRIKHRRVFKSIPKNLPYSINEFNDKISDKELAIPAINRKKVENIDSKVKSSKEKINEDINSTSSFKELDSTDLKDLKLSKSDAEILDKVFSNSKDSLWSSMSITTTDIPIDDNTIITIDSKNDSVSVTTTPVQAQKVENNTVVTRSKKKFKKIRR